MQKLQILQHMVKAVERKHTVWIELNSLFLQYSKMFRKKESVLALLDETIGSLWRENIWLVNPNFLGIPSQINDNKTSWDDGKILDAVTYEQHFEPHNIILDKHMRGKLNNSKCKHIKLTWHKINGSKLCALRP